MNDHSRDRSLDRLRGAAVLGMILVVSPGSWSHRLAQLDHAVWNGWTAADIVMPIFLVCVGMAIPLSARSRASFVTIVRRTILLITLGLILNLLPDFNLQDFRIPGVLQRIGICYFIGASLHYLVHVKLNLTHPVNCVFYALAFVLIMLTNYVVMHFVQIPGPDSTLVWGQGAASAYLDQRVFGTNHLWPWAYIGQLGFKHDPDGILSTLFASSAVIFGILFAEFRYRFSERAWWHPLLIGIVLAAFGLILDTIVSINKVIWSVSFSLLSVGVTLLVLSAFELSKRYLPERIFFVFDVFGSNSILAFVLSSILLAYHGMPVIAGQSAQAFLFDQVQRLVSEPYTASVLCAVLVSCFILVLLCPLHRRRIFLRL